MIWLITPIVIVLCLLVICIFGAIADDLFNRKRPFHVGGQTPMIVAQQDPQLFPWLEAAIAEGGGFIHAIADAAVRADAENYLLLRPVLLALQEKYPDYNPSSLLPR